MEPDLSASGLPGRRMGGLALAGVVIFATTCTAAQFARHDLNWIRAPLSSYLRGEYGWGVKAAYFALSVALVLLGEGDADHAGRFVPLASRNRRASAREYAGAFRCGADPTVASRCFVIRQRLGM